MLATTKTLNSHERARLRRYAQEKRDVDSFETVREVEDDDGSWGRWAGEPALSQRMDDEDDDDPIVLPSLPPTISPTSAPKPRVSHPIDNEYVSYVEVKITCDISLNI